MMKAYLLGQQRKNNKKKCHLTGTKKQIVGHILCHCFFLEDFLQSPSPNGDGLSLFWRPITKTEPKVQRLQPSFPLPWYRC